MSTRIGISANLRPPWPLGQPIDMRYMRYAWRMAEDIGLDRIVMPGGAGEPELIWLAAAAAETKRVRLANHVGIFGRLHPVPLARQLAALDILSEGRFIWAIGLGWRPVQYAEVGMSLADRAARTEEVVEIVRRLWTENKVSYQGKFHTLVDVTVEPKPVQKPHPPIHFGAASSAGLRRVARMGNGLEGQVEDESLKREGGFTPKEIVHRVRQFAVDYGRDPDSIFISLIIRTNIDQDTERAVARSWQQWEPRRLTSEGARPWEHKLKAGAYGPPELLVQKIRDCAEAGVQDVVLYFFDFDIVEQLKRLEQWVLPQLTDLRGAPAPTGA